MSQHAIDLTQDDDDNDDDDDDADAVASWRGRDQGRGARGVGTEAKESSKGRVAAATARVADTGKRRVVAATARKSDTDNDDDDDDDIFGGPFFGRAAPAKPAPRKPAATNSGAPSRGDAAARAAKKLAAAAAKQGAAEERAASRARAREAKDVQKAAEKKAKEAARQAAMQQRGTFATAEVTAVADRKLEDEGDFAEAVGQRFADDGLCLSFADPVEHRMFAGSASASIWWTHRAFLDGGAGGATPPGEDKVRAVGPACLVIPGCNFVELLRDRVSNDSLPVDFPQLRHHVAEAVSAMAQRADPEADPEAALADVSTKKLILLIVGAGDEVLAGQMRAYQGAAEGPRGRRKSGGGLAARALGPEDLAQAEAWLHARMNVSAQQFADYDELGAFLVDLTSAVAKGHYGAKRGGNHELHLEKKLKVVSEQLDLYPEGCAEDAANAYVRMLMQVPHVSEPKAQAIARRYPSLLALFDALREADQEAAAAAGDNEAASQGHARSAYESLSNPASPASSFDYSQGHSQNFSQGTSRGHSQGDSQSTSPGASRKRGRTRKNPITGGARLLVDKCGSQRNEKQVAISVYRSFMAWHDGEDVRKLARDLPPVEATGTGTEGKRASSASAPSSPSLGVDPLQQAGEGKASQRHIPGGIAALKENVGLGPNGIRWGAVDLDSDGSDVVESLAERLGRKRPAASIDGPDVVESRADRQGLKRPAGPTSDDEVVCLC